MENYYQLLGVTPFAPLEDIQKAYKKTYGELFVSDSPLANLPKLRQLKEALEILSDPVKRQEYDARLKEFLDALENRFAEAVEALASRRFSDCIAIIKECLKISPRESEFYETLGLAYQLQGTLDEALKAFQQGLQLKSRCAQFNWYIAEVYRLLRDDERNETYLLEAAEGFKEILKTDPRNVNAQEMLADTYAKMSWFDEAVEVYNKLIEMFPYKADYRRDLGSLYYEMNYLDEAEENLKEALQNNPEDSSALLFLGLIYYKKRLLAKAIESIEASLRYEPNQPEVRSLMEKIREVQKEVGRTVEELINEPNPDAMVEGTVKWYSSENGMGVLSSPEYPEVLLHFTALLPEDVDTLKKGDGVRFGVVKDVSGLIAVQVTRIAEGETGDTFPGKILRFDSARRLGMIAVPDGREVMFAFSGVHPELVEKLEVGLEVLFEVKAMHGISEEPIEQAVNVRARKKITKLPLKTTVPGPTDPG